MRSVCFGHATLCRCAGQQLHFGKQWRLCGLLVHSHAAGCPFVSALTAAVSWPAPAWLRDMLHVHYYQRKLKVLWHHACACRTFVCVAPGACDCFGAHGGQLVQLDQSQLCCHLWRGTLHFEAQNPPDGSAVPARHAAHLRVLPEAGTMRPAQVHIGVIASVRFHDASLQCEPEL